MNISRFFGSTNREAMRQVRLALGPDALIVSNRRVNGGVEILASDASAVPTAQGAHTSAENPSHKVVGAEPHGNHDPRPQPAYAGVSEEGLMHAIGALRGSLEGRMEELLWSHQVRQTPVALHLFHDLLGAGFSTVLLRALLKRLPDSFTERAALQWARTELEARLPVISDEDKFWHPGLAVALIGPTGVGKTTTLAKMAARAVRRFGPEQLVLITTDTYRIGAHEQLKIYADLLRVAIHVVRNAQQLRTVMLSLRPDQVVLIDNVGISQRDRYVFEQASLLANAGRRIQRLLVLNAGSQGDTLDEVARSYSKDGGTPISGCIISKLDEATRLGAALDTAIRYKLPIHYVSTGQKVPEDLGFFSAAELVQASMKGRTQHAALYTPSQADLAAMLNHDSRIDVEQLRREHERRTHVLPRLLAAASLASPADLRPEQAKKALSQFDDSLLMTQVYELWRLAADGFTSVYASGSELGTRLARRAAQELTEGGAGHALAMYVWNKGGVAAGSGCLLHFLHSPRGQALSSPYQQVHSRGVWKNSLGDCVMGKCSPAQALGRAVQDTEALPVGLPLLHVVQGSGATQWRAWGRQAIAYLALVPANMRIWHKGASTMPTAMAHQLSFDAIASLPDALTLENALGVKLNEISLWYAHCPVEVRTRGQEPLCVELVLLRVLRRHDGVVLKSYQALSNPSPECSSSMHALAVSLFLSIELKDTARMHAQALTHLQRLEQAGLDNELSFLAGHYCLAAWELLQSPDLIHMRKVAALLLGKSHLHKEDVVLGLFKLLALKEAMA